MNLTVNGPGRVSAAGASQPQTLEQLVADLVKFVESKPSAEQVAAKLPEVQTHPHGIGMLQLIAGVAPVFAGVSDEKRAEVLEKASSLLGAMRSEVAGGRQFELARTMMGTKNDRTGALLASAIDSPLKLDAAWCFLTLSAIQARAK
ncbi:MAG: hypothetical protein ACAI38_25275 [Myxococcota bacterium]